MSVETIDVIIVSVLGIVVLGAFIFAIVPWYLRRADRKARALLDDPAYLKQQVEQGVRFRDQWRHRAR